MRIAAIADIHGNLPALEAVLADIERCGADEIVNLGDICSGPLFPAETIARLMPLGLPTISGNHERQLREQDIARMIPSDRHAATRLSDAQRAWLGAMPTSLLLFGGVLLVHGTPASDLDYFLETVTAEGLRAATPTEVAARAGAAPASLILCGHTHIARAVRLSDGRMVVNPGSVGLPAYAGDQPFAHLAESGSPHARYAILSDEGGAWHAELRIVAYDWDQAAATAEGNGRADWARALRTGYA